MRTEQQQLLIKDLSARLPYGVRVAKGNIIYPLTGVNIALGYVELAVSGRISIEEARPYLRPMSSMTEEEKKEYDLLIRLDDEYAQPYDSAHLVDWLNAHHLDYRGLIPMGLALEAPDGMYNF